MSELTAPFSYETLTPSARIVIEQKTGEIRDRMRNAAQNVIEIGERLIVVKEKLGRQQFLLWLDFEFAWGETTAWKVMNVAKNFKFSQCENVAIAPAALYLLAEPDTPKELKEKFVADAKAGKTVSHKEVKSAVSALKSAKTSPPKPAVAPEADPRSLPTDLPSNGHPGGNGQTSSNGKHVAVDPPTPKLPPIPEADEGHPWADFNQKIRLFIGELKDW